MINFQLRTQWSRRRSYRSPSPSAPSTSVDEVVTGHDVHDQIRVVLAQARRIYSHVVSVNHRGHTGPTCEAVRRRRSRACVWLRGYSHVCHSHFGAIQLPLERVRSVRRVLGPEGGSTDMMLYRACAAATVRPPHPSRGPGPKSIV